MTQVLPHKTRDSTTGSSFSGLATAAVAAPPGRPVFHRGNYILRGVIEDLLSSHGLGDASHVVVSGDSAGGLATYLHAHQWHARLTLSSPGAQVVALPDSGFFADETASMPEGCTRTYSESMRNIFKVTNASGGLSAGCVQQHPSAPWACMLAANAAPHIPVPYLMLQSRYDTWQTGNELGSDDAGRINAFGAELGEHVVAALDASVPGSGLFLDACAHHTAMGTDIWEGVEVSGVAMVDAVAQWLAQVFGSHDPANKRSAWIAQDAFPCVKCCGRAGSHAQQPSSHIATSSPPTRGIDGWV